MIQYSSIKPKLYLETTVISYLVARPSNDAALVYRQQVTRQLWEEYANTYEFVVSDIVIEVCQAARFRPPIICTPIEIIEETQMREKVDTGMDAVLEECYRMKEEFNAQFKSMKELSDYLRAENKKRKALGWKYVSMPEPQDDCHQKN